MAKSRVKRKENEKKRHQLLKFFLFLILLLIILLGYAHYIEPKRLTVQDHVIKSSRITDNFNGFTIVHISDIHYGNMYEKENLNKLVKRINEYNPDIVVLTGDLLDPNTKMTKKMTNEIINNLTKIEASTGKFAITGNHDYKIDEWETIIKSSNFINLNNSYETIYNDGYEQMVIAGVSTMTYDDASINERTKNVTDYINSFEKNGPIYNILLLHEPDFVDEIENNKFQLILSGHTHCGQVKIPFYGPAALPKYGKKYSCGHYSLEKSDLYVSNGIGVSTVNFRLFNTPSFNVYRLTNN